MPTSQRRGREGKPEIKTKSDREKCARMGLKLAEVGLAFVGDEGTFHENTRRGYGVRNNGSC